MAIKGAKTIAEYAIRKWMESKGLAMECFKLEMCGHEAVISDVNGDTMRLVYEADTKMVVVME